MDRLKELNQTAKASRSGADSDGEGPLYSALPTDVSDTSGLGTSSAFDDSEPDCEDELGTVAFLSEVDAITRLLRGLGERVKANGVVLTTAVTDSYAAHELKRSDPAVALRDDLKAAEGRLAQMEKDTAECEGRLLHGSPGVAVNTHIRNRHNHTKALKMKLGDIARELLDQTVQFKDKTEAVFDEQFHSQWPDATPEDLAAAKSSGAGGVYVQSTQSIAQAKAHLEGLTVELKEIRRQEKDIQEIAELWKRIGSLVEDQGEKLDHIGAWVAEGLEMQKIGNEQLQVANKTKVSNRKKKCCIFAVVVIFLLVLLGPILGSMLSAT